MTAQSDAIGRADCLVSGPEDAGFLPLAAGFDGPWQQPERPQFEFRLLRTVEELAIVEPLQREVFGVSDQDLMAASMLTVLAETGGDVIGIFDLAQQPAVFAGYLTAIGGYVHRTPRLCSDMLAISAAYRHAGLGESIKRLQGALALERGFADVVWTVDPLRAANARLNFGKLGAYADRYERNRYGESYGEGLYGGMPTDRLHVTWPVRSSRVQRVLAGQALTPIETPLRSVPLPADIDALMATKPAAATEWRFQVRRSIEEAFADGLAVTGFERDARGNPTLLFTALEERALEYCE